MELKTIILIGGPQKGTRFRPLSLELPKPLFPIAGCPLIQHHIEACSKVPNMKEIVLIGYYQQNESLSRFIASVQHEFNIPVRYLQEFQPLGTVGGLYHFRDQIMLGNPSALIVLYADISSDFPLKEMWEFHKKHNHGKHTVLGTESNPSQASDNGCMVEDAETHELLHYVEKPETYVSSLINCGAYIFTPTIFDALKELRQKNVDRANELSQSNNVGRIMMGEQLMPYLSGQGLVYVFKTDNFWTVLKSAGSAIFANKNFLELYRTQHNDRLTLNEDNKPTIIGDVFIHPTASVHSTAVIGPNVSIGSGVIIGPGARVKDAIILDKAEIKDHCCILYSIVGWNCVIGAWSRIEGTKFEPNPNEPHARLASESLFQKDGRLIASTTVLGRNVVISPELLVRNSIVLPYKELSSSFKNEIIL
ncbi:mannose-1-phosphate guanyltransferase alpha-B-like [Dendronephthya gigantea]|uniref:mannose-1-phosphate guanyltransferase alpha-B-like n=1 Tax=Dendronephthya gigantea TaxID=151771 RepID=UPI00106D16FC|nr:mannose-1-phosphate guanyltransferase alpha-B-like [Dendronephthya gigantea]